ncbi:hypothetical protein GCM10010129_14790 [Streptomyces fumigatiscleroticus]|nr:hypothetical protein GCM10010129_14790 [Streptomyces fumigatiscleroticus]
MSKRQVQKMLQLMASGGPVELTSPMASVKKLSRLAGVAQQFGYEYADVRHGGGRNNALKMLIVPDPDPQARARAAQNWAQYPNAGDGVSLPPVPPEALELLKARINFDLTGRSAEKRMGYGALGATVACVVIALREGGQSGDFVIAGIIWLVFLAILGIGLVVTRKRNAKFAGRLRAAGFVPFTDETGRVRYLPPGAQVPAQQFPMQPQQYQQQPFAPGPYGNPAAAPGAPAGYAQPAPAPYAGQPAPQVPGPYAQPGPYGGAPQAPGPYAAPQPSGPYAPQPPYPQQNPHWQPPQR